MVAATASYSPIYGLKVSHSFSNQAGWLITGVAHQEERSSLRKRELERDQGAPVSESQRGRVITPPLSLTGRLGCTCSEKGCVRRDWGLGNICVFPQEGAKMDRGFPLAWKQNAMSKAHLSGGTCVSKSGSHLGHWFPQQSRMWPQRTNPPHPPRLTHA